LTVPGRPPTLRGMDRPVALVAGGARGIGRSVALRLARDGWAVAFCWRSREEEAAQTAAAVEALGAPCLHGSYDVSQPAACEALVSRVLATWGRLDALVQAVGPYHRQPLLETEPEAWHAMFDGNLHPLFYLSRLVAEPMKARGSGRIVAFAIAQADRLVGQPNLAPHYIAKVGVVVLVRTLARVLGPHGITANVVSPGYIDTGGLPEEELARALPGIPAGRLGRPEEVASVVHFLLGEEAAYVNGANILVSGGWGA
jgi:3-oxoacyl-[acyl-carrier protein] reductase